jgi:hypothetical protein
MSLLNLFQSKSAADAAPKNAQINSAAPAVAAPTGSAPSAQAAAVKLILGGFAEEVTKDAHKIDLITRQLMDTQHALLNNAAPHNAPAANARAREEIKAVLGQLHALNAEFKATGQQLAELSR